LDLIFVLVQSSMLNARLPQMVNQGGQDSQRVERTVSLTQKLRLRVALRIVVLSLHFFLAVSIWRLINSFLPAQSFGWTLLELFAAAALVLGIEFSVEALVLKNPERWAMRVLPLAQGIDFLLSPLSALFELVLGSSRDLGRRAGAVTEDELKTWVESEGDEGSLEGDERQMIYSIFHFGDTLVREIMVPRIDITALDVDTSLDDAVRAFSTSGHSRLPIYEETIDNIIGLLYAKDLLRLQKQTGAENTIRQFLRPAYFVPEAKKVDELLREMQARSVHMAIVVDEYGGMAGLVTLEDIVEEIVGEIRDEYDQSEELLYQQVSPDEYLFNGRIDVEDVNDVLGTQLSRDLADTLGGYIYGSIGRVPAGGEVVQVDGWTLKIEQVSGRRIRKVRAVRTESIPLEMPQEKTNDKR
jgi:CBS domain containing-hemolysin-like protein